MSSDPSFRSCWTFTLSLPWKLYRSEWNESVTRVMCITDRTCHVFRSVQFDPNLKGIVCGFWSILSLWTHTLMTSHTHTHIITHNTHTTPFSSRPHTHNILPPHSHNILPPHTHSNFNNRQLAAGHPVSNGPVKAGRVTKADATPLWLSAPLFKKKKKGRRESKCHIGHVHIDPYSWIMPHRESFSSE